MDVLFFDILIYKNMMPCRLLKSENAKKKRKAKPGNFKHGEK
jgi:hypothetical protein